MQFAAKSLCSTLFCPPKEPSEQAYPQPGSAGLGLTCHCAFVIMAPQDLNWHILRGSFYLAGPIASAHFNWPVDGLLLFLSPLPSAITLSSLLSCLIWTASQLSPSHNTVILQLHLSFLILLLLPILSQTILPFPICLDCVTPFCTCTYLSVFSMYAILLKYVLKVK